MDHIDDNLCRISAMMSDRRVNLNGNKLYYAMLLLAIKDSIRYQRPLGKNESTRQERTKRMRDEHRIDESRRFLGSDTAESVWVNFLGGVDYHLLWESLQLLWERLDNPKLRQADRIRLGKSLRISLGRMEV